MLNTNNNHTITIHNSKYSFRKVLCKIVMKWTTIVIIKILLKNWRGTRRSKLKIIIKKIIKSKLGT